MSETRDELEKLMFIDSGAMSFLEKEIPAETLKRILTAATSCAWLGRWKILAVTTKSVRVRTVEVWQEGLRRLGRPKDVEFVERWKRAPLFVVFCLRTPAEPFQWVDAEHARTYSIKEVGTAVRSLELEGLVHGVGLHGIMGMLKPQINDGVKEVLGIPKDQEIVYFGIMGFPDEEAKAKFPKLQDVGFADTWGNALG